MKKILLLLITFIFFAIPELSVAEELSSDTRHIIENRVRKYCNLVTLFSENIENITLLDSIFSMCENNKVQTFDDLTPKEKSLDIEYNSYPLFQYLQKITSKYENSLEVEYSDFTCESIISEPKMDNTGLNDNDSQLGSSLMSNSYALVNVTKRINGNGINQKVRLRVTVNLSTMKIGGTVSQDYEDPYSLYLEGISLLNEGKTKKGFELLTKCSNYKTFPGRYRAKTMMGIRYFVDKNYKECECLLRQASEQDPVAGIYLATLYTSIPQKEYFKPYEAIQLLTKYASVDDKDYSYVKPMANAYLAIYYLDGKIIPQDLDKAQLYIQNMSDYLDKNFDSDLSVLSFFLRGMIAEARGDSTEFFINLKTLDNVLENRDFINNEIEKKIKPGVYWGLVDIYNKSNNQVKKNEYIEKLKALGSADANAYLAIIYRNDNNISEALKYYQLAADAGNGLSAYIMSRYYAPQKMASSICLSYDADLFDKYLYEPRLERDFNKAKHYARLSAEANNLDGMCDLLYYCVNGPEFGGKQDLYEGLKWACSYSNKASYKDVLKVAQNLGYFSYQIYQNKDKKLLSIVEHQAVNNDPASNYLLYMIYSIDDYIECDTVKAAEYLIKSADAGFYIAMSDLGSCYCSGTLFQKDIESAMYWYKKMADMNYPAGWSGLAYCEGEYNHNYEKEKQYYLRAFEMRYPDAAISLAEYCLDGEHGFEKDPTKALYYLEQMQVFCNEFGIISIKDYYPKYEEYVARAKQEVNGDPSHGQTVSQSNQSEYIAAFDAVSNPDNSPELRISEAERLLSELFESSSVIVKTVGSNNTTVIATETAGDFIMRLCTSPSKIRIVRIDSHVNGNGKFTDLKVKEEK